MWLFFLRFWTSGVRGTLYTADVESAAAAGVHRAGRKTAIPVGGQTRDSVLRVAEGHAGPSVVSPVPAVFCGVHRRLLGVVRGRVQAEVVDGQRLMSGRGTATQQVSRCGCRYICLFILIIVF